MGEMNVKFCEIMSCEMLCMSERMCMCFYAHFFEFTRCSVS